MIRPLAIALIVLALVPAGVSAADGKRYAVLVGVQKYDDAAFASPEFSERDATELATVLTANGYDVTLLTDTAGRKDKSLEPTKTNLEKALKTALGKCRRDDTILVAFSGHGVRADAKSAGFLCPKDAKPLPNGKPSLISVESICDGFAGSEAHNAVLLVDACRKAPDGDRSSGIDGSGLKLPNRVFALFSCSPGESAIEHKDIRHGVFFSQVLAALTGAASDGNDAITFATLAQHIRSGSAETGHEACERREADARGSHAGVASGRSPVLGAAPGGNPGVGVGGVSGRLVEGQHQAVPGQARPEAIRRVEESGRGWLRSRHDAGRRLLGIRRGHRERPQGGGKLVHQKRRTRQLLRDGRAGDVLPERLRSCPR